MPLNVRGDHISIGVLAHFNTLIGLTHIPIIDAIWLAVATQADQNVCCGS